MSFMLTGSTYKAAKYTAQVFIPAAATAYVGLAEIWNWPNSDEVAKSSIVVNLFLGTVLLISQKNYDNSPRSYGGTLGTSGLDPDTGMPMLTLRIKQAPEELLSQKVVRLDVDPVPNPPESPRDH